MLLCCKCQVESDVWVVPGQGCMQVAGRLVLPMSVQKTWPNMWHVRWYLTGPKVGVCPNHAFCRLMCPAVSKSEVHCVKCPALSVCVSK